MFRDKYGIEWMVEFDANLVGKEKRQAMHV
jgi:hypothetical protein